VRGFQAGKTFEALFCTAVEGVEWVDELEGQGDGELETGSRKVANAIRAEPKKSYGEGFAAAYRVGFHVRRLLKENSGFLRCAAE
jgi:hypothetical protein